MKAVILAGGQGTRLRPLTYTRAKPMVPFLGKPAMEGIVEKLKKEGFSEIIITTNYKADEICDYFCGVKDLGIKISVVNEKEALGTAGSVKNAAGKIDGTFAVVQGDSVSDIKIQKIISEHKKARALATICLMEVDEVSHFGIAEMEGDAIVRFKEKPTPSETFSNLANAGIYILEPEVLDMIPLAFYDFSKDLFPKMLSEGKKISGSVTKAYWRDIGCPEDYLAATRHYLSGKTRTPEGCKESPNFKESYISDSCDIAEDCTIERSVLFPGVKVYSGAAISDSIIGKDSVIGEGVQIEASVIGDRTKIGPKTRIRAGSRIGPDVIIPEGENVSGEIIPDEFKDL